MEHVEENVLRAGRILGIPLLVLRPHRVCIPAECLALYDLPPGGRICVGIDARSIKLSVSGHGRQSSIRRTISKNRIFVLPEEWAEKNHLQEGSRVFLIGSDDGLILYAGLPKQDKLSPRSSFGRV